MPTSRIPSGTASKIGAKPPGAAIVLHAAAVRINIPKAEQVATPGASIIARPTARVIVKPPVVRGSQS
jgi:hypothetical protein